MHAPIPLCAPEPTKKRKGSKFLVRKGTVEHREYAQWDGNGVGGGAFGEHRSSSADVDAMFAAFLAAAL